MGLKCIRGLQQRRGLSAAAPAPRAAVRRSEYFSQRSIMKHSGQNQNNMKTNGTHWEITNGLWSRARSLLRRAAVLGRGFTSSSFTQTHLEKQKRKMLCFPPGEWPGQPRLLPCPATASN